MIFDTHAHYDDSAFDEDREQMIDELRAAGVGRIVNCGASLSSSESTMELTRKYDLIYGAVGVHPDDIGELFGLDLQALAAESDNGQTDGQQVQGGNMTAGQQEADAEAQKAGGDAQQAGAGELIPDAGQLGRLRQLAGQDKALAIGEIGLDYHWDRWPRALQQEGFRLQWKLAIELGKPVVIHSRDAAEDTMLIAKEFYQSEKAAGRALRADMHCYSYSAEQAEEYLKMGFYFGVGGVLTFKNARKLREVAELLPLDRILLETDCPYLAPEPFRGKRNNSSYIRYVAEALAGIKGVPVETVYDVTYENAMRFYLG